MVSLQPLAGFDWARVKWGGPHDAVSDECSYCGATIPDDDMPLRLWAKSGHAAVFCEACQRTWWGMESFERDDGG
jgi:hypothetical protein